MKNVVRSTKTISDEELAKLKELDWEAYYRESAPTELQGLSTCPDCNAIVIVTDEQPEVSCYQCGKKIKR
jgi:hypothetical protein